MINFFDLQDLENLEFSVLLSRSEDDWFFLKLVEKDGKIVDYLKYRVARK